MKCFFTSVFFLIAACSFAEIVETDLELKNDHPSQIKTFFIPYLQLAYGVIPGAGCSIRVQKAYLGVQFDANVTVGGIVGANEVTLSALFYPQARPDCDWNYGGWNLGIGGGTGNWYGGNYHDFLPVFPFFVGYQGQKHFFCVAVHPLDRVVSWLKWIPSVKYGWCF